MKLLLDQGLPRTTRDLLGQFGHEVTHVGDVGMACAKDEEILVFAREHDAILPPVCSTLPVAARILARPAN